MEVLKLVDDYWKPRNELFAISFLEYFVVRVKVLKETFSRLYRLLIMDHKFILPIDINSLMTVSLTLFRMAGRPPYQFFPL